MVRRARLIVLGLLLASAVLATPLVEVNIPDRDAAKALTSGGFDIVRLEPPVAEVVAWERDLAELDALGLSYRVIHEDLEAFYRSRLDYELDDMGGYPTFDEIRDWYDDMLDLYPDLISEVDTIGYSLEDRPLWAFKVSDNPNEDEVEPEVFFNAAIHAREVITPLVLMTFTEYLCENYEDDPEIADLVDGREIWMLPVSNPDGYTYNEENDPNGGGMWRKNKREVNNQVAGVDLNRNWPFMWGYDDQGSSPNYWSNTYRGASAGSEPETQAMIDFINEREFQIIINYHSYSNLVLYPYGYDPDVIPDDIDIYEALADSFNQTLGWITGNAPGILYPVNGDASDWQEGGCDYNTFGYVVEVGSSSDGFWPPTNRIDDLTEEQIEPLLAMLRSAGDLEALAPPTAPTIASPDTVMEDFTITWQGTDELEVNAPYTYSVLEMKDPLTEDTVAPEFYMSLWTFNGFVVTGDMVYSAPAAYYSGSGPTLANTLTAANWLEVETGDIFTFQCYYEIEEDWDYAYVQVSTDGSSWTNLQGNITTESDPNGSNDGHGITGFTDDWTQAEFPLEDYVGQSILIRFAYITDTYVDEYGLVIDDISPIMGFETIHVIASNTTDTTAVISYPDSLELPETRWYKARCIDAQSQQSEWSQMSITCLDTLPDTTDNYREDPARPLEFDVSEVYPNPFNPGAALSVTLPQVATVRVTVFDVLGREVQQLSRNQLTPGMHTLQIDGSRWASGIYFLRVETTGEMLAKTVWRKAVLLK